MCASYGVLRGFDSLYYLTGGDLLNKLLIIFLVISSGLFADGISDQLMRFDNVGAFIEDLKKDMILNEPTNIYSKVEYEGEIIGVIQFKLTEPLVNVIVLGRLFTDEVLREIIYQSEQKQIEPEFIVQMLFSTIETNPTREDVQRYSKWFYRIRAFGVPSDQIIKVLQVSPPNFLKGDF